MHVPPHHHQQSVVCCEVIVEMSLSTMPNRGMCRLQFNISNLKLSINIKMIKSRSNLHVRRVQPAAATLDSYVKVAKQKVQGDEVRKRDAKVEVKSRKKL